MTVRVRKNVYASSALWPDDLLWYARGVAEVQKRPITDVTSWTFLGAMHGFDQNLWTAFGWLQATTTLPTAAVQNKFWRQCQHQSWYFLPWHRAYLAAFEAIILQAIVKLSGPADWALPYWNYSKNATSLAVPPAFYQDKMPDGAANPLKVKRRYGDGSGKVVITATDVQLNALLQTQFAGPPGGGGPTGFGGPQTVFNHAGNFNGQLESRPHNGVHGLVGGMVPGGNPQDGRSYGLMSMPDTAGLDPIFWLHHANIDRLWQVWIGRSPLNKNPADAAWLTGPANHTFAMPKPDGTDYIFAAKDTLDTQAMGYVYDDVADPFNGLRRQILRSRKLNLPTIVIAAAEETTEANVAEKKAELMGSNDAEVRITGAPVETHVKLDAAVRGKMLETFSVQATGAGREPDRIFLNLENIRGLNDAAVFYVYVALPEGADPAEHPDNLAGVVSLFGVRSASRDDSAHGGNGISETLEITDVVDRLHLGNALTADQLKVRFVSRSQITPEDNISVGRVSVSRQSQ